MSLDVRITGRTKLLGLIGNPVGHSCSPQLHNTLSALLGIDAVYIPLGTERGSLGDVVKALRGCGFIGFNVTIPFKEEILKYVDECTDDVKRMGSANTVTIKDGRLYASNTDAPGFVRSFERQAGFGFNGRNVVLLGAGGTAMALGMRIAAEGAFRITIVNRTVEKAERIAERINSICFGSSTLPAGTATSDEPVARAVGMEAAEKEQLLESCDIIVNTTSVGMHPDTGECPVSERTRFNKNQTVYDVIYNPSETSLIKLAGNFGCKAFNGSGMLFYQGVLAYETWMGISVPQEITDGLYVDFSNYLNS